MAIQLTAFVRQRNSGFSFSLFAFIFAFLIIIGTRIAFEKLGIPPSLSLILIFASLMLSSVNLPAGIIRTAAQTEVQSIWLYDQFTEVSVHNKSSSTKIFLNVGGAIVPILISIGLIIINPILILPIIVGIVPVSLITYKVSRIIPNHGIGIPLLLLPLVGLTVGLVIAGIMQILGSPLETVAIAIIVYTTTTIGTFIGADILNLAKIRDLQSTFLSIGGAGTFDGIFLVGVLATLVLVPF